MSPRSAGGFVALCAVALWGGTARGQSLLWLRAEGVGTPGVHPALSEVDASGRATDVGDWLARASWAYGLGDFGSQNYTALLPVGGAAPGMDAGEAVWNEMPPGELIRPGSAAVFGVQMRDRVVTMTSQEFAEIARRAGTRWTPATGAGGPPDHVVVRRVEGSKVIVRGEPAPGQWPIPSGTTTTKRGERAEIRPIMDPTTCTGGEAGGGVLPVRVYVEGDAVAGGVVIATHLATGAQQRVIASDKGIADLQIDQEGAWRVEFHAVFEAPRDQEAQWVAYTATLSFETVGLGAFDGLMDSGSDPTGSAASGGGGGR